MGIAVLDGGEDVLVAKVSETRSDLVEQSKEGVVREPDAPKLESLEIRAQRVEGVEIDPFKGGVSEYDRDEGDAEELEGARDERS